MELEDITKIFKRKKPTTYLNVTEAPQGIQTFVNPLISQFNKAYKEQTITFLQGVIKELEK